MSEVTPSERRALIEMVRGWRCHQDLRFYQWLWVVCGRDPFYIEGDDLSRLMEEWFEREGFEVGAADIIREAEETHLAPFTGPPPKLRRR